MNGKPAATDEKNSFARLNRTWNEGDTVDLAFHAMPRATHWYHEAQVFERGPLVFALPLEAQWKQLKHYAEKSSDWQLEADDGVEFCGW